MDEQIIVSIVSLTFNHEPYIVQAIESFLMQKTNFKYEIIIHDDASTDNTQKIISKYEKKYPEKIVAIYQKENQHSKECGIVTKIAFSAARGKYIALCEGDDYWTDPYKLQKQVDFMEAHTDCGLLHTNYSIVDEEGHPVLDELFEETKKNIKNGKVFYELLDGPNFIGTLTVMMKTEIVKKILNNTRSKILKYTQDYWLWLRIADLSEVFFLDFNSANYRVSPTGISHKYDREYFLPRYWFFLLDAIENALNGNSSFPETKYQKNVIAKKIISYIVNKHLPLKNKLYIFCSIIRCPYLINIISGFLLNKIKIGEKGNI